MAIFNKIGGVSLDSMLNDFRNWKAAVSGMHIYDATFNVWYKFTDSWLIIITEFAMDKGKTANAGNSAVVFGYNNNSFYSANESEFEMIAKKAIQNSGETNSQTIVSSSTDVNPYGSNKPYFEIYTDYTYNKNLLLAIHPCNGWTGTLYRTIMTRI